MLKAIKQASTLNSTLTHIKISQTKNRTKFQAKDLLKWKANWSQNRIFNIQFLKGFYKLMATQIPERISKLEKAFYRFKANWSQRKKFKTQIRLQNQSILNKTSKKKINLNLCKLQTNPKHQ